MLFTGYCYSSWVSAQPWNTGWKYLLSHPIEWHEQWTYPLKWFLWNNKYMTATPSQFPAFSCTSSLPPDIFPEPSSSLEWLNDWINNVTGLETKTESFLLVDTCSGLMFSVHSLRVSWTPFVFLCLFCVWIDFDRKALGEFCAARELFTVLTGLHRM